MEYLLQVKNLKKYFPVRGGSLSFGQKTVKAIDGVSFSLREGETIGLVGESGCGKTTVGRTVLRLYDLTEGEILFRGEDIARLPEKEMRKRRKNMQMIFQDPYSSLNPRFTAGEIVGRALDVSRAVGRKDRKKRILELLDIVGLGSGYYDRYPVEFSGGQRQRIGIARAIACSPKLIVADEPISALDVSIQAQIVNLFYDIQREFKLSYIFITHNLAVIRHVSDTIVVMYLGRIVEMGRKKDIFENPLHPYTRALISAQPDLDPDSWTERIKLSGEVPSPIDLPEGCRFYQRCPFREERCRSSEPELSDAGNRHYVACGLCPGAASGRGALESK